MDPAGKFQGGFLFFSLVAFFPERLDELGMGEIFSGRKDVEDKVGESRFDANVSDHLFRFSVQGF